MENTCSDECAWHKKYFRRGQKCPFYLETIWTNDRDGTPKTIKDCAPKRSVLLQMETTNRMIGLQQASEQERNQQHAMIQKLIDVQNQYNLLPEPLHNGSS